jgi:hypothetical protein
MQEGVIGAGDADAQSLKSQIEQLKKDIETVQNTLDAERSKGFWSKVFGRPATTNVEGMREKIRGRIAMALIVTLIILVLATLGYLVWLSIGLADLTTEDLITVIPMVGATLLTPLVGLIGAVTGFYYGGQQALQAASEASQASRQTQETSQDAQKGVAQAATQAVAEAVTPAATEAATKAATHVVSQTRPQEQLAEEVEAKRQAGDR